MPPTPPNLDAVLATLLRSHDRLASALTPLTEPQSNAPSYDDDWTIGQVASHLGSGAEVFELFLDAGVKQTPAPGVEQFQPVWARWNAKSGPEQVADVLRADAAFADRLAALSPEEKEQWRLDMFGSEQTLAGVLQMRLGEHALHTWDIAVALDPAATVSDDAIALIIDRLPSLVERVGKPSPEPVRIRVTTTDPSREFLLDLTSDGARLEAADSVAAPGATGQLRLTGEAFVRLIYGRLDPDHTPGSVAAEGVELDTVRHAFPGV
ncbi:MAG: hypothetical protein QOF87_1811 [Pseudonocardiales bacterium]|nr:hypothetical protein [Pseudonocardiales bacterium]